MSILNTSKKLLFIYVFVFCLINTPSICFSSTFSVHLSDPLTDKGISSVFVSLIEKSSGDTLDTDLTDSSGMVTLDFSGSAFVGDDSDSVPSQHRLFQNFPNPFGSPTTISYDLSAPYVAQLLF